MAARGSGRVIALLRLGRILFSTAKKMISQAEREKI